MELKKREVFDNFIRNILGSSMLKYSGETSKEDAIECEDDQEKTCLVSDVKNPVESQGRTMCQHTDFDRIVNSEVSLKLSDSLKLGKVKRRIVGPYRKVHRCYNDNPALKTIMM